MKIKFENEAYKKLLFYVNNCDVEISGYGKSRVEKDEIIVEDVIIIKQKCTGTQTDIDDKATFEFFKERLDAGEDVKSWNVWWHSHVNMGVFWSATDENTAKNLSSGGNYLISIVANKRGEYLGRVDIFPKNNSPFEIKIPLHEKIDIPGTSIALEPTEVTKERSEEIKNQIKELNKELGDLIKDQVKDEDLEELIKLEIEEKVLKPEYKKTTLFKSGDDRDDDYGYYGYGYGSGKINKNFYKKENKDSDFITCPGCKLELDVFKDFSGVDYVCPYCGNELKHLAEKKCQDIIKEHQSFKVTKNERITCKECKTVAILSVDSPNAFLCPTCSNNLLTQDSKKKE
jgi:predicted RNA-binding Zn-ribbon protein involved in translation (DUF1610 family)